jgi:hypothetical protein
VTSFEWKEICSGLFKGGRKMEAQAFHLRRFTVPANSSVSLALVSVILSGRAGSLWFPQDKPGSKQNHGHVGILDSGLHAVHHRCLPAHWTDLVRRLRGVAPWYMAGLAFRASGIHWFARLIAVTSRQAQGRMARLRSDSCSSAFWEWMFSSR